MSRVTVNGVQLNVVVRSGPPGAPVLVLLHGFTGDVTTWSRQMERLSPDFTTIAVDALGHGASDAPADAARYSMPCVVADTLALLAQLKVERCALLGYSMGGRMALQIAAAAGERITALVLESASPGLQTPEERAARVAADEQLAQRLERDGIASFVDSWESLPLFASQHRLPAGVLAAQREQRLRSDPRGLAGSLRGAGTGAQPPLHDRLPTMTNPTLLIAGELDAKFCAIGREMQAAMPQAELAIVPGAGHAVHLEAPDEFDRLVLNFLRRSTWHP